MKKGLLFYCFLFVFTYSGLQGQTLDTLKNLNIELLSDSVNKIKSEKPTIFVTGDAFVYNRDQIHNVEIVYVEEEKQPQLIVHAKVNEKTDSDKSEVQEPKLTNSKKEKPKFKFHLNGSPDSDEHLVDVLFSSKTVIITQSRFLQATLITEVYKKKTGLYFFKSEFFYLKTDIESVHKRGNTIRPPPDFFI